LNLDYPWRFKGFPVLAQMAEKNTPAAAKNCHYAGAMFIAENNLSAAATIAQRQFAPTCSSSS
jgi:hypothetical protein